MRKRTCGRSGVPDPERPHLSEEGAVELDDVGAVAAPHDHVQVHQQLLLLLLVNGGADPLRGHASGDGGGAEGAGPRAPGLTFTAMIRLLGLCTILLTEPYAPRPISPRSFRSSAVKSQCCSEIFSFPDDSMLCVRSRSLRAETGHQVGRGGGGATTRGGATHMCGFWKGGPAVFSVNLVMGLIGGLAKFSFRALRLPVERGHLITWSRDLEVRRSGGTDERMDTRQVGQRWS